jgi:hypothetical protein
MLTPARMQTVRETLPDALAEVLTAVYCWDEALQMHQLDRPALNATPQRGALEAALKAAELSAIGFTHPASTYQFYNLGHLNADIDAALARDLEVLHLAVEPVPAAEIYTAVTGEHMPASAARIHHEDMRTRHADLRGRTGPYLDDRTQVLDDLRQFFETTRAGAA